MCQNNTAEKYFILDDQTMFQFSTINKDGPDNYRFQSHVTRPLPVDDNTISVVKSVDYQGYSYLM